MTTHWMGYDVETSGDPHDHALQPWRVAQGTSWVTSTVAIDPVRKTTIEACLGVDPASRISAALRATLEHALAHDLTVVGWNVAFDIQWMIAHGLWDLVRQVRWLDGMLLWKQAVLEPETQTATKRFTFGLKECVRIVLPQHAGYEDGVDFHGMDPETVARRHDYNRRDVAFTLLCARHWWSKLNDRQRNVALIEAASLPQVARANFTGMKVDTLVAREVETHLDKAALIEMTKLRMLGATREKLASPVQLAALIFDEWGLPSTKVTATGGRSTDKEVLTTLALDDPRVAAVLKWRNSVNSMTKFAIAPRAAAEYNGDGMARPQAIIASTYCTTADTLHQTSRGVIPFHEVQIGERVLTHQGRERRVLAKMSNGIKPVYRLTLSNGLTLDCTGNHPVFTADGAWVRADQSLGLRVQVHADAETWRPVTGWPYFVSSWGRVMGTGGGVLRQHMDTTGRLVVTLSRNGAQARGDDRKDFRVYRLVAATFLGPPTAPEIRHLNGFAWDNRPENLAYGTRQENATDAVNHGRMVRDRQHRRKLTDEQVDYVRASTKTQRTLAEELGVSFSLISQIRLNQKRVLRVPAEHSLTFRSATVVAVALLGDMPTFGMEIEEDHSHVTGGVVTHNTARLTYASNQRGVGPGKRPGTTKQVKLPIGFALHQMQRGPMFRQEIIAPEGFCVVEFDAAGQEFRWMAIMSNDQVMLRLCRPGEDPHGFMGAQIGHKDYREMVRLVHDGDKTAKSMRQLGKVGNLSCQYRTSPPTLRKVANIQYGLPMTEQEAKHIIDTYRRTYPGVPLYWQNQIAFGRQHGYVENLAGRRVRLRGNWMGRGTGWALESATINWPIQSIGAEQKYLALKQTAPIVHAYGNMFAWDLHDGLYFYARTSTMEKFMVDMKQQLDHLDYEREWGYKPTIPLPFDCKFGPSWGKMQEVKF